MKARGIDFVGVAVSDMDAARTFYGDLLGLAELGSFGDPDRWLEFDAGNVTISLIKADAAAIARRLEAGPFASIGIAVAVEDIKTTVEELRQKGVPVTMDASEFPPCFTAMVQDPSGNHVWLHQRKDGSAG